MNVPKPAKEKNWLYVCLDASDGTIETEILSKNDFCTVKMLGATSSSDLDKNMLREADVVAVWHTIQLDDRLLGQFKKPPKVEKMGRFGRLSIIFYRIILKNVRYFINISTFRP